MFIKYILFLQKETGMIFLLLTFRQEHPNILIKERKKNKFSLFGEFRRYLAQMLNDCSRDVYLFSIKTEENYRRKKYISWEEVLIEEKNQMDCVFFSFTKKFSAKEAGEIILSKKVNRIFIDIEYYRHFIDVLFLSLSSICKFQLYCST